MKTPDKVLATRTNIQAKSKKQSKELSNSEVTEYNALCATIVNGLRNFMDVGGALIRLRDGKLYREEFDTFDECCDLKFGMTRQYGYRLMVAAKVVKALPENVNSSLQNPASAVALAAAPEKERASVLKVVAKTGEVTPKAIKEEIAKREEKKSAPKKEEAKDAEFEELDELGKIIPSKILPEWNRATDLAKLLRQKASEIKVALKKDDRILAEVKSLHEDVGGLYSALNDIAPHSVCPKCTGNGCAVCSKRGFISKSLYRMSGNYGDK